MENKLQGGQADNMSIGDIAKKHNVSIKVAMAALRKGLEEEKEHTYDPQERREITMDHLVKDIYYYDKLKKVEATEQTMGDASGSFEAPMGSPIKREMPPMDIDEVTDGSSSGSYDAPYNRGFNKDPLSIGGTKTIGQTRAVQDKNFPKWGGPESVFVKVKEKCKNNPTKGTREPNCNQGDINNLEFYGAHSLKESIEKVSKERNIPYTELEKVVINEIKKIFID
jgi:hypothetical protein